MVFFLQNFFVLRIYYLYNFLFFPYLDTIFFSDPIFCVFRPVIFSAFFLFHRRKKKNKNFPGLSEKSHVDMWKIILYNMLE